MASSKGVARPKGSCRLVTRGMVITKATRSAPALPNSHVSIVYCVTVCEAALSAGHYASGAAGAPITQPRVIQSHGAREAAAGVRQGRGGLGCSLHFTLIPPHTPAFPAQYSLRLVNTPNKSNELHTREEKEKKEEEDEEEKEEEEDEEEKEEAKGER
ncbi:hypothetical protein E2C01_060442 [Portunus trituberculatus]|uniref:Uncharacterized protein n=1 Tax=Portunus trituberculatus TaxID=210409 RepID=A0A5B7H9G7_PORTR|nr:hypothetical protein [Portunus trituberculatus]